MLERRTNFAGARKVIIQYVIAYQVLCMDLG